ncbi:MAG: SPOR domain-containing protein [Tannerellaceae bacterium]|jgi:hypothetical protein|nr:SPOR domain-containing protein [Tannerellaceae bacterium]
MDKRFYLIALLIVCAGFSGVSAQYPSEQKYTIFDALQEPASSRKGRVTVDQPPAVQDMVGARRYGANIETVNGRTYLKVQGYRVQVFSGNEQRVSKEEALRKEKQINESFPHLQTYVTLIAPFWKLRVGDYGTHEEAFYVLRQLARAFPSFGKEMYIVREEVKIPLDYYY